MMQSRAKLFYMGNSQAVRLPKGFRFVGAEVIIRRVGYRVILEPLERSNWPDGFWDIFQADPDFEITPSKPSTDFSLD